MSATQVVDTTSERPRVRVDLLEDDAALANKIKVAVEALKDATAARDERAKVAGRLLLEAHNRHPGKAAFQTFLKQAGDVRYSRAMELISVVTDRKTYAELKANAAARQQRRRDKIKALPKAKEPDRDVTDAGVDESEAKDARPQERSAATSAKGLEEFKYACREYLPKLNTADMAKARAYFDNFMDTR
jgi:hypothetical protein